MAKPAHPRVLLIEDHAILRELITVHLQNARYDVTQAASLRDAVELLDVASFDVIITDVHLPDGDSVSALHEDFAAMPDVPVIFITGDSDRELAAKVLAEDPAGFLIKPFDFTELVSVTANAIRTAPSTPARGRGFRQPIPVVLRSPATDHKWKAPRTIILMTVTVVLMLLAAFLVGILLIE